MVLSKWRRAYGGAHQLASLAALLLFSLTASGANPAQTPPAGISREAAESAAGKFRQIQESSDSGRSFGAVRISETEINSYIEYELAPAFPPGLSKVRLHILPGRTDGKAEVDFDRLRESSRKDPNPLLAFFLQGVHTLGVEGTLAGSNGAGLFHLDTVSLDDVAIPQFLVDYLIEHYLKSRYPAAAIDRNFELPASIEKLTLEEGSVLLEGRPATSASQEESPGAARLEGRWMLAILK